MSIWWAKKEQLDKHQLKLIEDLPLHGRHLIIGPPGSGKTNVLLRRAQFVRVNQLPNVLVLSFTRPLTEFIKTGCFDSQGREIFPSKLVTTLESWIRKLYKIHKTILPNSEGKSFPERKANLATGAMEFIATGKVPHYDCIFVDEAQDLLPQEVSLLNGFSPNLFFVGDNRQKIYNKAGGLTVIRELVPSPSEHNLMFHYRLVEEICQMADRIQLPENGEKMADTCHYDGPRPGSITAQPSATYDEQITRVIEKLHSQVRVYSDMIRQGDLIGLIVPKREDRDKVYKMLELDSELSGMSQIVQSWSGKPQDGKQSVAIDPEKPICIMTVMGCKGLEFRAVHWLFCNIGSHYYDPEIYYTVVTRAKTSLDLYFEGNLPDELARSYSPPVLDIWK